MRMPSWCCWSNNLSPFKLRSFFDLDDGFTLLQKFRQVWTTEASSGNNNIGARKQVYFEFCALIDEDILATLDHYSKRFEDHVKNVWFEKSFCKKKTIKIYWLKKKKLKDKKSTYQEWQRVDYWGWKRIIQTSTLQIEMHYVSHQATSTITVL